MNLSHLITNRGENTLKKRLQEYIPHTSALDILVGYFYFSGFHYLKSEFQQTDKIRILVGMGVDEKIVTATKAGTQLDFSIFTQEEAKKEIVKRARNGFKQAKQTKAEFDGLWDLIQMVSEKKIEIRGYTKEEIHSKMYLLHTPHQLVKGSVLIGSSNLSKNGLEGNLEMNALISDERDYEEGKEIFEQLWNESVDIAEMLADDIEKNTWLKPATPAEIFYRAAYEYVDGSSAVLTPEDESLPSGFMKLQYQDDAANQAVGILEEFGGVILGDVVGLGKTIVGASTLRKLKERNKRNGVLVLIPPGLMKEWEYWTGTLSNGGIYIRSCFQLEEILSSGIIQRNSIDTILLDESHNFRNADSGRYSFLQRICRDKNVVLLSATPQTKNITDLEAQVKLFTQGRDDDFAGILDGKSVSKFFAELKKIEDIDIRSIEVDKLLRKIMIRRTRSEIMESYEKDIKDAKLKFPTAKEPNVIDYFLSEERPTLLHEIEQKISKLFFPRFKPKEYFAEAFENDPVLDDLRRAGTQLSALYRILIFKRLESSIEAARKTIRRQIDVNKKFVTVAKKEKIMPFGIENVDFLDLVDEDTDFSNLGLNKKYELKLFQSDKLFVDIEHDCEILEEILSLLEPITADKDGKLNRLKNLLDNNLKGKKVLIFSESKETAEYVQKELEKHLGETVGFGHGGLNKSATGEYEMLKKRFSPKSNGGLPSNQSELSTLVATDSFSEGVNLQDGNIVVNYDLPWNPVRIIQRVGRVNRVGTQHDKIYSYNFFPDPAIDEKLTNVRMGGSLKDRVKKRIAEFHAIIGDDTKHLSPGERPEPKKYFEIATQSTDRLEGDTQAFSYSMLLTLLRKLREENIALYERVQQLPERSWTSRNLKTSNSVVAMAKRGKHKEFFEVTIKDTLLSKLSPEVAFEKLWAEISETSVLKKPIVGFGEALMQCEEAFKLDKNPTTNVSHKKIQGTSIAGKILKKIKSVTTPTLPEEVFNKLLDYGQAIRIEKINNKKTLKAISNGLINTKTSIETIEVLEKFVPYKSWETQKNENRKLGLVPEILLSSLFITE